MKTITTIQEAAQMKAESIRYYESKREYAGNAATDQRIDFISNMSDEDYMRMHNETARRENAKTELAEEKRNAIVLERKETGMSKKAYRAEYDRLNALYKAGDLSVKAEMRRIQRFAFN